VLAIQQIQVHSTLSKLEQIQVHSTLSKLAKVVERCIALGLGFDSNGLQF